MDRYFAALGSSPSGGGMTVSEHDQKRLEALELELRASEELKSRLIACSRDCIKVLDLEGRLLFMNEGGRQALEICDFAPFVNGFYIEFWQGADRVAAQAAIQLAKDGQIGRFVGCGGEPHPGWER